MAQFDFYDDPGGGGYLLDVQADLLDGLNTRVVVPLMPKKSAPRSAAILNPLFVIDDAEFILVTQFMAAIPAHELQRRAGTLAHQRYALLRAIDMVFVGL
ncbi:MAG TPA: CcdB family protein [Candidatus Cybelea sp.]|nr:CcdB family protein [Candidatus Cybelea sp.]